jgi:hypothetical protein
VDHAGNFALNHDIYMADLPDVRLEEIETAGRDDWRYSDSLTTKDTKSTKEHEESVESVKSVSENVTTKTPGHQESSCLSALVVKDSEER